MKIAMMAATLLFSVSTLVQGQSMPGMTMPGDAPAKQTETPSKPAVKKKGETRAKSKAADKPEPATDMSKPMPGMTMGQTEKTAAPPQQAGEMADMPGMQKNEERKGPQTGSITHDTMNLQEPENPSHKTGGNLPVPDLLKEIVTRPALSLKDFTDLAEKSNPTLAQASSFVRRSTSQARQAGFYPNPTIGYQGEQIRGGSYGGGEQGAFIQQSIVLGGKLGLRRSLYTQQKISDQLGLEEQTLRVRNDVTQAFYTALTSQAMVVVRQRLLGLALDAVETVHQLANVGQADSPDILQAEVEGEQAKIDFFTAQREFLMNFHVLAALSGKQDLSAAPLAGSLESPPEMDADQQVNTIVSSSPVVKRMEQDVAIGEARLRMTRRETIPDLLVKVGEQYNFEHITAAPVRAAGPQSFASVGVNLPLWNRNQGNVETAQTDVERAKAEVSRARLALRRGAEPRAQAYATSRFTADRYRTELIPRAQRAYQLYLTKYQNMAMAYPQVLVSQRTLFQLQIGYLAALHEVWSSAISLENYDLTGGLEAPTSGGSSSTAINLPFSSAGGPE